MADHAQTAIEASAAITSASSKSAVAGAFVGWLAGLDPMTVLGVCIGLGGLLVSFLSFLINWYYMKKEDQRADELHQKDAKIFNKTLIGIPLSQAEYDFRPSGCARKWWWIYYCTKDYNHRYYGCELLVSII